MHGSGSSLKETATIWLYLDESGGDDTNTAIMGGLLIPYPKFHSFEDGWEEILERHHISWPLHMIDFSKNGPLGHITTNCRFELFSELSDFISKHRLLTMVGKIRVADFRSSVDALVQKNFGVYGMNFALLAVMNAKIAHNSGFPGRIPYVLDNGNSKNHHVVTAHAQMCKLQKDEPELINWRAGGLHFEDDRDFALLQASDLISWAARRREDNNGHLPRGMDPINRIFRDENQHSEKYFEAEWMKGLSDIVMDGYRKMVAEKNETKEYD